MRLIGVVGTAILFTVLGTTVPAYGQRGDQSDRRGKRENKAEREKPGRRQEHAGKQPQRARERVVEQHRTQRPEHAQQGSRHVEPRREQRVVWQQHRARQWQREHRTWQQRGGYRGYRIPHDRFAVYFGREHRFRVHTLPIVVFEGRPRFQCHGFWFTLIDPWPEYWSANWYETDDVYVDYVHDGYYMYNSRHPGVAIAVNISM